jgi:hypothetical protein
MEALSLALRLLGLQAEASKHAGANPFRDVPAWADRMAAYAYSLGLTCGVNDDHTLFDPDSHATCLEFSAFLLRALGYKEKNGDFEFSQAFAKGAQVGLYSDDDYEELRSDDAFSRADAVMCLSNALLSEVNGSGAALIDILVENDVVSQNEANSFKAFAAKISNTQ